jgi:hypothetical protein
MRAFVTLLIAGLSVGCAAGPQVYTVQYRTLEAKAVFLSGRYVCIVHHVPFVTRNGFRSAGMTIVDASEEEWRAMQKLPNFVQPGWALRYSKFYSEPTKVTYCPKCEEEVRTIWKVPRP